MFKNISKDTLKETFRVAAPAMIESFFTAVVTFIDSKMVSSLGTAAVASVALTTNPIMLRLTPFTAMNIATAALIARRKGEGRQKEANEVLLTSLTLTVLLALVISIAFFFLADPLIHFAGSLEDTHDNAVLYFRTIIFVTVFTGIQNCINAAHRGAGFTKISMQTHLVSTSVNLVFNFLLIEGRFGFPRLEIFGAALASCLGMVVACILSILSLFRKTTYLQWRILVREKLRPKMEIVKRILKLAYSVFIEQVLIRFGMLLTSKMAAGLGTNPMAAQRVAGNFTSLSYSFGDGLQAAAVALVGRSLGQGRPDLAKSYAKTCRIIGICCAVLVAIVFFLLIRPLFALFFKDPAVVDLGASLCVPLVITVFFQIQQVINIGALRGAGDTLFTAILGVLCTTLIRPAGAYLGAYLLGFGLTGIWLGIVADQVIRFAASAIRLAKGKWMTLKI